MANIPQVSTVSRKLFCVVSLGYGESPPVAFWSVYDLDGKVVSYGESGSTKNRGVMLNAMTAARRSAQHYLRKESQEREAHDRSGI